MSLPIRALPIVEHWDCHSCARCCHGSEIPLTESDLAKLESHHWNDQVDFKGTRIVVRSGQGGRQKVLAKRPDGACVFLMADGLCRIHRDHGPEAKPGVCQTYPLQLVPHDQVAYLTLRRSCPSAAAGRGRKLEANRDDLRRLVRLGRERIQAPPAPPLTRQIRLPWKDLDRVLHGMARLMSASHYPVVRRLVHTLLFCDALEQCDMRRLEPRKQAELLTLLEESVLEEASQFFRERKRPDRITAGLMRQSIFHYLRLHPEARIQEDWRSRLLLTRAVLRFIWGRGAVPNLAGGFAATFQSLEEPLGPLESRVLEPLNLFLETASVSARYILLLPTGWNVMDGFRNLALSYVAGMWQARLFSTGSKPTREMMVDIVVALDRGQGFEALTNFRQRRRIRALSLPDQLAGLVAWYAQ